jgi:hypothetical protein
LAEEIDPYIEQNGRLHGLMVYTEFFPGWADFAALISHLKFVRNHQSKIEKVAAVSDSGFLKVIPSVARHFVKAEVKHFDYHDKDKAVARRARTNGSKHTSASCLIRRSRSIVAVS